MSVICRTHAYTWLCAQSQLHCHAYPHMHTVSVSSDADVVEAGLALGRGGGGCGGWERWGREEPCRGAHNRLINGPRVTAIKVACQRRSSESQRRFSAMIEEPSFSAALSTAKHSKASLLLFKGTSLPPFLSHLIPAVASLTTALQKCQP